MTFKLGNQAKTWGSAALFFLVTTVLCGVIYTAACTGLAQLFFPHQANGSIIEVDGTKYGSELVGQRFTDEKHLWGRAMNPSTGTFTDAEGNDVLWYAPSNLSPAGDEFATAVQDRVEQIRAAHPEMGNKPIPSDLVTNSGSGASEIRDIIKQCTEQPQFGFLGDARVNVLKVNLMLDGVL